MFKKTYNFSFISKLTLLMITLFISVAAFAEITEDQTQQIQSLLNNYRARLQIPAVAMSISLPNSTEPLTFLSGTTTMGGSQKITNNSLFQAGSISKSFTAMAVLELVRQGKVSLDDPITKYLPQYPRWHNVTIRQLLNHTSGIFNYTKTGRFDRIRHDDPQAGMTPEQIVNIASSFPSYFPPGKGWKYSNTNYVLAGMIIEKVTHEPISTIMEYYLHGNPKLHLTNTFYRPNIYSSEEIAQMAHGYSMNGTDVTTSNMAWAYTAGAIVSNSTDLLTWWQGLFKNNLLPNQQLAQMMSLVCEHTNKKTNCIAGRPAPHLEEWQVDKRYGLGIIQSATGSSEMGTVWWHNGSTQGYKAIVMWYPKSDIYVSFMIDRDPGYLLTPSLPLLRNTMQILLKGSYTPIATAKRIKQPHKIKHIKHHQVKRQHHHKHSKCPQPAATAF